MKRRTKIAGLAAVLGASFLAGQRLCNTGQNIPSVYSDNLVVNVDDSKRFIVRKDEEKGIKDIRALVSFSNVEEAWVFIPDQSLWLETGRGASPRTEVSEGVYETQVREDVDFLFRLFKKHDRLVLYHFHRELDVEDSENNEFFVCQNALPSAQDLTKMIASSAHFYSIQPNGEIIFKVCSPRGVAEYKLTDAGKAKFGLSMINPLLPLYASSVCSESHIFGGVLAKSVDERINRIARYMSDDNLSVSFQRYN